MTSRARSKYSEDNERQSNLKKKNTLNNRKTNAVNMNSLNKPIRLFQFVSKFKISIKQI